jgi:hypothetical protein
MAGNGNNRLRNKLFGVRAVERGMATEEQILDALRSQYNAKVLLGRHLFIGEVLLLNGVLSSRQLAELLRETGEMHEEAEDVHSGRFFGDVAVEMGYCTPSQVFEALNVQLEEDQRGDRHRLIGEILYGMGVLDAEQVRQVIDLLVDRMQEPLQT